MLAWLAERAGHLLSNAERLSNPFCVIKRDSSAERVSPITSLSALRYERCLYERCLFMLDMPQHRLTSPNMSQLEDVKVWGMPNTTCSYDVCLPIA